MEWLYDIGDWLADRFAGIGDFFEGIADSLEGVSTYGIIFGLIGVGFIFAVRKWMLLSFTQHMPPGQALFWQIATYAGCGIGGFFIGKHYQDTA